MEDKQTNMKDLLLKREREDPAWSPSPSTSGSANYQKHAEGKIANPCSLSAEFSRVVIHTLMMTLMYQGK